MKTKISSDNALTWLYCKKCKQHTNHRILENDKKFDCIYCESKKNKRKWGISKLKPKGGWTKLKFRIRTESIV